MPSARANDVWLGLAAVLLNIALVAGVVWLFTGHPTSQATATTGAAATSSAVTSPAAATGATSPATASPSATSSTRVGGIGSVLKTTQPVTIVVLGDDTGDEPGEWVSVMADLIATTRTVSIRQVGTSDPPQYGPPRTLGSAGSTATIWNASRRGGSAASAAAWLGQLVPATPTVVLLSYGRNDRAESVAAELQATATLLRKAFPTSAIGIVLQPPTAGDTTVSTRLAIATWARANQLPTIDVAAAFARDGDPQRLVSSVDPISVNAAGGRLWAQTVVAALGGDDAP